VRPLVVSAVLAALAPAASLAQERPTKAIPQLAREPKPDGQLKDFPATLTLKPTAAANAGASFTGRVGWRKDTLYVGVEATGDQVQTGDELTLSLFFPDGGPAATGHVFHLASDGKSDAAAESGTSEAARKLVNAGVQHKGDTLSFELAIPARAFPRFPAEEPLVLDLCLTYRGASNCKDGGMVGEALKLPDEFRKGLKLKPPAGVLAFQGQKGAWLGYGVLHYPTWVEADARLTPGLLKSLVTQNAAEANGADVNVPETLSLPDGRPLVTVLSGESPYTSDGKCDSDKELRLGLYLVKGKTAQRVLEWPAATCALGRATSMMLDEEGALSIGYSNGPIINFAWSGDHFERTELGKR
jgi:hypothetical protein